MLKQTFKNSGKVIVSYELGNNIVGIKTIEGFIKDKYDHGIKYFIAYYLFFGTNDKTNIIEYDYKKLPHAMTQFRAAVKALNNGVKILPAPKRIKNANNK